MLPQLSEGVNSLRVSEAIGICNAALKDLSLTVEGEIANFSVSRGTFVFFDLKDEEEDARVNCFMMASQLSVPLEDGMRVVLSGRAGLYKKSGQFRLTVSRIEPKGEGSLKRAFELLKAKLQAEGLFAKDRKRALPAYPQLVGIISSAAAAGYGDFMKIASSRLPGIRFILANVAVQGKDAEREICQAFDYLNSSYPLDLIVLIRGGGSMEDLHAFNSEPVARAISRSKAPVVVGVGHEKDVTIADYVADLRAATPSNAAQLIAPTKEEVIALIRSASSEGRRKLGLRIRGQHDQVLYRIERIGQLLLYAAKQKREHVLHTMGTIEAISPAATMQRGYTLTLNSLGKVVRSVADLKSGDKIVTTFHDGQSTSTII